MPHEPTSIRDRLEHGWTVSERLAVPSGMEAWPSWGSLRAALRATDGGQLDEWSKAFEREFVADWTKGCQGLAFGDDHLFVTQNSIGRGTGKATKGIYKLDSGWNVVARYTESHDDKGFTLAGAGHWGDVETRDGAVYVAGEAGQAGDTHRIVELDPETLTVRSSTPLRPPRDASADQDDTTYPHDGGSLPWCAIHPWNDYLYTSNFTGVTAAYAYDPSDGYRRVPEATVEFDADEALQGIQGGAISSDGHLYLSSYTHSDGQAHDWEDNPDEEDWLFALDTLTGRMLGRRSVEARAFGGFDPVTRLFGEAQADQELEGITVETAATFDGPDDGEVHTVLLDRQLGRNKIHFKSFASPWRVR